MKYGNVGIEKLDGGTEVVKYLSGMWEFKKMGIPPGEMKEISEMLQELLKKIKSEGEGNR